MNDSVRRKSLLASIQARLSPLPRPLQYRILSFLFGRFSPYFRTNRMRIADMAKDEITIAVPNHRALRNHVRGIHAAAINLACEYASGLLLGQYADADKVVVVKTMHLEIHKPITGAVRATARHDGKELADMLAQDKGSVRIPVTVVDSTGATPVSGYMDIAWFKRRR
ncbi:DUF4442 domain-containing protein [Noviherbaspirillum massiliense]|uniref:DUF4442 domain-containing protein n=1 Tax=Noviherbaspirillum massiliense TaxID=1465823 RepID=UPI001375A194|nr:DUF4442 domain-containing protein [Noviherbaspirillum massiliense]